jgi:predicted RNase H-like HicB family nuclease
MKATEPVVSFHPVLDNPSGRRLCSNFKEKTMPYKVSIVIEKDDFGYYAYSPELEGCQTQGDTFEEVMANIKEAIELYLSTLSDEEIKASLSKEILTTSLEVRVA